MEAYGRLPLSFEENHGQTDPEVKFLARGNGYTLFLKSNEAVLSLRGRRRDSPRAVWPGLRPELFDPGWPSPKDSEATTQTATAVLRMELIGANPNPDVVGQGMLPGKSNYFIGNDASKWHTNVPSYAKVRFEKVYPGIDLIYYGNQGNLEYDFVVAPGADPGVIEISFDGADRLGLDDQGKLLLHADGVEVRLHEPVNYQDLDGARVNIEGHYVLRGERNIGFELASYYPNEPLIIDPVLVYSTYLGGESADGTWDIAVDAAGNMYLSGTTRSSDFPVVNSLQANHGAPSAQNEDAFVAKLNPDGSALVYATYLGGNGDDDGDGISVDLFGNAHLVGYTFSTDFPITNSLRPGATTPTCPDFCGGFGFVAKLNAEGSELVYSMDFGGARAIVADSAGNAYVTGSAEPGFPLVNPLQAAFGGGLSDAFVSKINADGSALVYSTYLGGSGIEGGADIALDDLGSVYIAGTTNSADFPIVSAFQGKFGGPTDGYPGDAFVAKLTVDGSELVYCTYLGGPEFEDSRSIAVDTSGNAYVTGRTNSPDFPTVDPLQSVHGGGFYDAFVTKLDPQGSAVYSTYLGGSDSDESRGIAVDASGNAHVIGETRSADFPNVDPFQPPSSLGDEHFETAFLTKINADGSAMAYSTYLGEDAGATGIAVDVSGIAYITGATSADFPTVNPLQVAKGPGLDAFVAKIGDRATGTPIVLPDSVVNGASYSTDALAPDSWADLFGQNLATQFLIDGSFPDSLGGTTLVITDSLGTSCQARLHFVMPERIQFLVPRDLALGPASLRVTNSTGASTTIAIEVTRVAPGLFSANASGQGPAAASFLRVKADGSRSEEFTFTLDAPPNRANVPIDLGPEGDAIYVSFFGTGFRSQSSVSIEMGGLPVPVLGAVAQGQFEGLDQLVVGPLPRALAGRRDVNVQFTADGKQANLVTLSFL